MSEAYSISVRIPKERIGVLIGKDGMVKKMIEEAGECIMEIDSQEGDVLIIQKGDPLKVNVTGEVVRAIGRGFNPDRAYNLFNDGFQLVVLPLRDVAKKGSNRINEIKGRIIGREGKTRQIIEDITDTMISVYGDTVSLIGDYISMKYALQAVEMLIEGRKQRTVYSFLESRVKDLKMERLNESFR